MTKDDRINAKRQHDAQNRLVDAVNSLRPPKLGAFRRLLSIANSPLFLVFLGLTVSFLVFYRQTYVQCVSDSRKLFADFIGLETELMYRKNDIVTAVLQANTIAELRQNIDPKKYFGARYKDDGITDIETRYALDSEFIDQTGINRSAESALTQNESFQKFSAIFNAGIVPPTLTDNDIPTLRQVASVASAVQMIGFFTRIRTEAEIECIRPNVLRLMWGETPVTIQRFDVGSFSKKELFRLRAMKDRNLLTPRVAPAPFPETDFRPSDPVPDSQK